MSRMQGPAEIAIRETRRLLTKLEFVAMEIVDQTAETELTNQLVAIQRQTESAAFAFQAIERQPNGEHAN